jgi:Ni,Fe-hydrogenase III small subunit
VGAHGGFGDVMPAAWDLPSSTISAAGSCGDSLGDLGQMTRLGLFGGGAVMLKGLCRKAFGKALWVYHANTGACNGCDIEVINVLTPYYDAERFGIKLVGSPRHADVLLVCGPVTRQSAPALKRLVEAVANPKLVFAIGSCAAGGGSWFDTYNVLGGTDKVIPVDFYIPGCPPRPEAILYGVAFALGLVPKKVAEEKLNQETLEELAQGKSIVARESLLEKPR